MVGFSAVLSGGKQTPKHGACYENSDVERGGYVQLPRGRILVGVPATYIRVGISRTKTRAAIVCLIGLCCVSKADTQSSSFSTAGYMSISMIGERACTVDDLRNEAEAYKRQLEETTTQAVSGSITRKFGKRCGRLSDGDLALFILTNSL